MTEARLVRLYARRDAPNRARFTGVRDGRHRSEISNPARGSERPRVFPVRSAARTGRRASARCAVGAADEVGGNPR